MIKGVFLCLEPLGKPINDAWGREVNDLSQEMNYPIITPSKVRFKKNKPFRAIYSLAFFFFNYRKAKKYDIIHLECSPNYFKLFKFLPMKKCIHHFQSSYWFSEKFDLKGYAEAVKEAKAIIAPNEEVKERLSSYGIERKKVIVLAPGIILGNFVEKKSTEPFTFLFASAPTDNNKFHEKGVDLLIDAFKETEGDNKLVIVWRGFDNEKLAQKIEGVKNIEVVEGIVDMKNEYARANALVFVPASNTNTPDFPFSLMESMAAGRPVIVSDNIYISNLVKKEGTGIVIETGNKEQLCKAMLEMKSNSEKYSKMCRASAERLFNIRTKVEGLRKAEVEVFE